MKLAIEKLLILNKIQVWYHFSVILVIFCGVNTANSTSKGLLTRHYTLDRTAPNYISPGYYTLPVDRTTFSLSHPVFLEQFDVSRIFMFDPTEEIYIHYVSIQFKLVEIYRNNFEDKATILAGQILMNSTYDAKVKLSTDLKLDPAFLYEIRLEMPNKLNLMYNEYLKVKAFEIKRPFGRSIEINMYQYNSDVKPPHAIGSRRKVSQGMVKRLYFKYSLF